MIILGFPHAARFLRAAEMHREAARTSLAQCPRRSTSRLATEVIYLSGYVVECGLKAVLVSHTPLKQHERLMEEVLKGRIKHNLELLKDELIDKGIVWPLTRREQLRRVRSKWSSEMRYDARRSRREDAEEVLEAAEELFRWATGG